MDDDPDDQLLFKEALSVADTSIACFTSGDGIDALEKLQSGTIPFPDVIFMDVNMPRMNGIQCLAELQKSASLKTISVIMYSTSSYYKDECFGNGAVDYMEKPNDFGELCNRIELLLSNGLPLAKTQCQEKI